MPRWSFALERLQGWQRSSILFNGKRLSGMPLLLYNSFVLWNCRELESMVGSYKYARLLWGIAVVSMLLEIWLTHCVLSFLREINYGTSSPLFVISQSVQPSVGIQRAKRMLVHRSMGSLAIVSSGVLTVFQHRFPNGSISILPLLNAGYFLFLTPAIAYVCCLGILSFLSHSAHPFSGVICGALAGLTWSANLSSFLLEPYWAHGTFFFYVLLCTLSLKSTDNFFVPCIDYKPWDSNGRWSVKEYYDEEGSSSTGHDFSSVTNFEHGDDLEENLLLLSARNYELRHLNPNIEELEDDFNQNGQEIGYDQNSSTLPAPADSASNAEDGVRSRRAMRL